MTDKIQYCKVCSRKIVNKPIQEFCSPLCFQTDIQLKLAILNEFTILTEGPISNPSDPATTPAAPASPGSYKKPNYWWSQAPSALTATTISYDNIRLDWSNNDVTGFTGIRIYRSTDGINWEFYELIMEIVTTHSATRNMTPSTLYYFRIHYYTTTNLGVPSNIASATTDAEIITLAAPTNFKAVPSLTATNTILLSWTNNEPTCDELQLYISGDGISYNNWGGDTIPGDSTGKTFTNGGYYFKIRAKKGALTSDFSNVSVCLSAFDMITNIGQGGYSNWAEFMVDISGYGGVAFATALVKLAINITLTDTNIFPFPDSGGNYNGITIVPIVAGLSISGNINGDLLLFDHTENFNIDGRVNFEGAANLEIKNTYAGKAAVHLNGCTNSDVVNCVLTGAKIVD